MPTYSVTIPIAGHVVVEVEADDEKQAKDKAWEVDLADPHVADLSWEALEDFGKGNICACPSPWEIEVEEV